MIWRPRRPRFSRNFSKLFATFLSELSSASPAAGSATRSVTRFYLPPFVSRENSAQIFRKNRSFSGIFTGDCTVFLPMLVTIIYLVLFVLKENKKESFLESKNLIKSQLLLGLGQCKLFMNWYSIWLCCFEVNESFRKFSTFISLESVAVFAWFC